MPKRFGGPAYQSNILGAIAGHERGYDPAFQMADRALREARAQAAGVLDQVPPARIGLVLATTKANIEALERVTDAQPCSENSRRHLLAHQLAVDLAGAHGAAGPVQCVSVACISGMIAIAQGEIRHELSEHHLLCAGASLSPQVSS